MARAQRASGRAGAVTVFGGSGFIGRHYAEHALAQAPSTRIVLVDQVAPPTTACLPRLDGALASGQAVFVEADVRRPLHGALSSHGKPSLIVNAAAIHREPGHAAHEYFETNIAGAENVCDYASRSGCPRIVFTSSIAPYGPGEEAKDEATLPTPETPYGSSKLVAEKIHQGWQQAAPGRRLVIVRPGVVYGAGENGNVSRLVRSLLYGYFVYVGNRQTRKAGGYVKELCAVIDFALAHQDRSGEAVTLLNFSAAPVPSLEELVDAISKVIGRSLPAPGVPRASVMGATYAIHLASRLLGVQQPINPVRMRKIYRSTHVVPQRLQELGYRYRYTLEEAFADWVRDDPALFTLRLP